MKKYIEQLSKLMELGGTRKEIGFLIVSGAALILSLLKVQVLPFDMAWFAIILCGVPIIMEAIIGLITEFDIKADVLVSLALIASVIIGEYFAAGEVAVIMQIGGLLEELTVAKARQGIEKLVHLTPQTARRLEHGTERIIPAEQVVLGDILRVLPGEAVPVDGVILSGQTSINQSVMTGESMPVDKIAGDEVCSGTVNQFGTFEMKATKVGKDSSIQRMIRLVQSADAGKAKIVGIADRWATCIVVIALLAAAVTWLVSGQIIRSVTILVVFCPCALVLATPTAIMAAIGNATKHGFLVREGDALERLAKVQKVTFDKTGTLTYGTPEVIAVRSFSPRFSDHVLYQLVASGEALSEHPLGKAITESFRREDADKRGKQNGQENSQKNRQKSDQESSGLKLLKADQFKMIPGQGIGAVVDHHKILAGNIRLMVENQIQIHPMQKKQILTYLTKGCTVIYVAVDLELVGYVALADTVRKDGARMVKELQELGVEPVLLTGDHQNAAETIASELGIKDCYADCLPEDKLKHISAYQVKNQAVCMIGDGVNDAPALKKADVGIAMGGIGSDIAVDAADIALVNDEVKELPHLIALSHRMMTTIKINLSFSMGLNFVAIILAITGILNPVVGALVHNCGSVLVIINSALLLRWRRSMDES